MFSTSSARPKKARLAKTARRRGGRRLTAEPLEERLALSGGAASLTALLFPFWVHQTGMPVPFVAPAPPAVSPQAGDGIELTSPTPRQIVQRDAHNVARLDIAGSVDAPWTRVEARAVVMPGFAGNAAGWEAIDVTPEAGAFSGELVVGSGWYQLEVRALDGQDVVGEADVPRVGVGEVFVTAGQSNAANSGWPRLTPSDERVAAYGPDGWQFAADPQPFASASGGTPWSVLGGLLAEELGVPVGLVSLGWGSTAVADWQPGGELYQRLADTLDYLGPEGLRAVLWHQGEADAYWSTSTADYAERLGRIISQSRADAGWEVPWGVALASFTADSAPESRAAVVAAQQQVIDQDPLVFQGAATDDLLGFDWRYDNLHFNEVGLREHAARWFTPICQQIAAADAWTPTGIELGTVDDRTLGSLDLSAGDLWYRATAARTGLLTLLLEPGETQDGVSLALYGADGSPLVESGPQSGSWRIDRPVEGGAAFYVQLSGVSSDASLRLLNLVAPSEDGTAVTVYGTDRDDEFAAAPHRGMTVVVNGVEYQWDTVTSVQAFGGAGFDTARLYGSPGDERFTASDQTAALEGGGFRIDVDQFEAVHGYANSGNDTAEMTGSPGDDRLIARPIEVALVGEGFYRRAKQFDDVTVRAGGGFDSATLDDSPGDDTFFAGPTRGAMLGAEFANRFEGFDRVTARASAGGRDAARLYDSAGDDRFTGTPTFAVLSGEGFSNRVEGFDEVHAYANGGHDVAWLFDSAGDDRFYASPLQSALWGQGFYVRAKLFERVYADAGSGGHDTALLTDSLSADLLEVGSSWARLSNAALDFLYQVGAFDHVTAVATTPGDTLLRSPVLSPGFVLQLDGTWQAR